MSHIQYADGREVRYSYNPLRHLQEMEDWLGITKIATDSLGRAEKVQYSDGETVSYTYGKAGERISITYPDGKTIYLYMKRFLKAQMGNYIRSKKLHP